MRLRVERVSVTRPGRTLLDDLSLTLEPGQLLALLGPNGAGKTTLLRCMLGLVAPSTGQVRLDDDILASLPPRQRAARVAWLPQHSQAAEELSALEAVMAARFRFDEPFALTEREARSALARVSMAGVAERALGTLSGGERQRVALAGLLAQATPILLVDEPANHLDPAQQIDVYRLLGELWREGRSVVCVTHDVNLLRHLGEPERVRVAGVAHGRLHFEHGLDAPELPERLGELFGVHMRAVSIDAQRVLLPGAALVNTRSVLFVVASLLLAVLSLWVGPSFDGPTRDFVFYELRLPRLLVGALVGATLSISGAAFQAIFNNALATPSTVGTTAGATLGALLALAFDVGSGVLGVSMLTAAAFGGALVTTLTVSGLAASGRLSKNDVLLAGIAVTLAAGALASGVQYASDARALVAAAQWSLGQLPQVGYRGVLLIAPFASVTLFGLLALARPLQNLALGEELAQAQGVHVARLRFLVLLVASLGVAACVAWCGPIAFVGLIVPHIVRLLAGPSLRSLLPLSFLGGAAFLVICDALARIALPGRELPVGVVTAALGAPTLVFLVSRARRE